LRYVGSEKIGRKIKVDGFENRFFYINFGERGIPVYYIVDFS
jgi:hypothetical protein